MSRKMQPTDDFDLFLQEQLKDNRFQYEWHSSESAYEIAKQVIAYRSEQKLTQRALANRIGTSQSAIARIESFEYDGVTVKTLEKIAQALNLDLQIHFLPKVS